MSKRSYSVATFVKLIFVVGVIVGVGIDSLTDVVAQDADAALNVEVDESPPESEPMTIPPDAVDLPAEVYDQVSARSIGISGAESSAYYAILNHAQVIPEARLRQAARGHLAARHRKHPKFKDKPIEDFPPFVDLFQNPHEYVGKPVTMSGYTRRLISVSADSNPYGIKTLYELWLFTDDSQNNPLVVVCTEVPEELPRGDELTNGISVTGYFFKLYGYDAADSKRLAPMILAHRIEWKPPQGRPVLPISPWVLYPSVIAVVALVLFFLWYSAYRDRMNSPLKRSTLEMTEKLTFGEPNAVGDVQVPVQMPSEFPDRMRDTESDLNK